MTVIERMMERTGFPPTRKNLIFLSVMALVHLIYFLLALHYTRIFMGDSFEYIYEAVNIKRYFFFYSGSPVLPITPDYMTQRQPGYPLFLLSVYLFTINNWIVIVLQNLISIFNICYVRHVLRKIGLTEKSDWLLLILLIAYPSQFINANTIAPDILYFGNFIRLWQTKALKYAVYMSLALVGGFMIKPVLYPFAIPHFIIVLTCFIAWKVKTQRAVLIALIPLISVFMYNYANLTRTGKFHFSSNQAFNAVYYFFTYYNHTRGPEYANNFLQTERARINEIQDYKEKYEYANERGMTLLKQNFFPYMLFHLENSARIFIEPGKAEMDLFTGRLTYGKLYSKQPLGFYATWKEKGISGMPGYFSENPSMAFVIIVLIFNCLRLIGIVLFLRLRSIPLAIRLFVALLLCYFALAAGPIANTRYFLPVSLLAIGSGTMGLYSVLEKRKQEI